MVQRVGARAAMREGLIEGWKRDHPGSEPPAAMVVDPIAFVVGKVKGL